MKKIHVLHGPNLNRLGKREPEIYGFTTLAELNSLLSKKATQAGAVLTSMQTNSEARFIEAIQGAGEEKIDFLIVNAAAFTHTSLAIRDALLTEAIPFIEVHISNIYAREPFRHHSYLSDLAEGVISGLGINSYSLALQAILEKSN